MFDHEAEVEENRQLDKLLDVLTQQNSDDSDEDSSDDHLSIDDGELTIDNNFLTDKAASSTFFASSSKELGLTSDETVDVRKLTSLSKLVHCITLEEFNLITDCKDPLLKEILTLICAKEVQIKALIAKYEAQLADCNICLKYLYDRSLLQRPLKKGYMNLSRFGFPYFRNNGSFPPNNADYFKKKAKNVMNLHYENPGTSWPLPAVRNLKTSIIYNFHSNHFIGKMKLTSEDSRELLQDLDKYWENVSPPALFDDSCIEWHIIAEKNFKDSSLDKSMRAMWNNYLHPLLDTSDITEDETKRIKEYIKDHPSPNWLQLSQYLGTNRSEHNLCKYYRTVIMESELPPLSPSNDEYNSELYGDSRDYERKASMRFFPGTSSIKQTTRLMRHHSYLKSLENCKTGAFSIAEDLQILALVKKFGTDFDCIADHMPHRNKYQIKQRYIHSLGAETMTHSNYTVEEDSKIMAHVKKHGAKNWRLLSQKIPRNVANLRQRYMRIQKALDQNPEMTLEDVPRKGGFDHYTKRRQLIKQQEATITNGEIPDLEMLSNRKWRLKSEIDDQLVQFFSSSAHLKKARNMKQVKEEQLQSCAKCVKTMLGMLQSTLDIPNDLEYVGELDEIDKEVLNYLKDEVEENPESIKSDIVRYKSREKSDSYMPPNVSSIQALRFLLLESFAAEAEANFDFNEILDNASLLQWKVLDTFKEQFRTFFRIPALMSIIQPPECLGFAVNVRHKDQTKPVLPRKVGRPKKDLTKINIMNAAKAAAKQQRMRAEDGNSVNVNVKSEYSSQPLQDGSDSITSFAFVGGQLLPSTSHQAKQPETSVSVISSHKSVSTGTGGQPKVLMKLDKTTVQILKQQNLLRSAKPLSGLKQTKVVYCSAPNNKVATSGSIPAGFTTPTISDMSQINDKISKGITYCKKRCASNDNNIDCNSEKKVKLAESCSSTA